MDAALVGELANMAIDDHANLILVVGVLRVGDRPAIGRDSRPEQVVRRLDQPLHPGAIWTHLPDVRVLTAAIRGIHDRLTIAAPARPVVDDALAAGDDPPLAGF